MNRFKKVFTFIALFLLLLPISSKANESASFKAEVIEIIKVEEKIREDGTKFEQQDLKLLGLEGAYKDQEITYNGVSEIEVANAIYYQVGDRVFVDATIYETGETVFYVVDFVRSGYLYILFAIFVIVVLLVGRFKGFKALISLVISFIVIIKFILPQILSGHDPFLISLIGGLIILGVIIYLTEGFKKKSHIAIISVLFSLLITLVLSVIFTKLTKLSGLSQEEATFLIGMGQVEINFQGLLLAGFIIGAIGILDDIIIGQIEAVEQIKIANPNLPAKQVFNLAYKIGNTHLGAIINTLFLTYAGAALPLLLLFLLNQNSDITFSRLINIEMVSTEIVRTFVGSIGVILSMPIATFLATIKIKK